MPNPKTKRRPATASNWTPQMIKLQALTLGTMTPANLAALSKALPSRVTAVFRQTYAAGPKGTQVTGGRARKAGVRAVPGARSGGQRQQAAQAA